MSPEEKEAYEVKYALTKYFGQERGEELAKQFLAPQEKELLIRAIHYVQDLWQESSDDLAKSDNFHDRVLGRQVTKDNDRLDVIRRKLGDKWEPHLDYKAPDDLSGLEDK